MLGRSVYPELIDWYGGDPAEVAWYVPCLAVMAGMGLDNGTPLDNGFEEVALQPINRYNMAQILYNFLKDGGKVPSYNAAAVQASIGDWSSVPSNYQDALMAVVSASIITGVDSNGTFNGNGLMTRGQAAVVLCRMYDVFSGNGETTPTDPTTLVLLPASWDRSCPVAPPQRLVSCPVSVRMMHTLPMAILMLFLPMVLHWRYQCGYRKCKLQYGFLELVNEARVSEGHEPLTWGTTDSMEEYTLIRCNEIVSNFSHDRPKGSFSGEVCAKGYSTVHAAFNGWMNSSGHKHSLMSDTYSYMTAASSGNYWIICLWSDSGLKLAEKWSSNNYDYSATLAKQIQQENPRHSSLEWLGFSSYSSQDCFQAAIP